MPEANRKREVGRGERVLPGVWRLRLPLPWPGVPHCNAWALAAGDGIVLVDTGMHEPGSMAHLERALAQVNLNLDLVRLLVCTHAHSDHYGQAATIVERTGCELWMHPNHEHMLSAARDPEAAFDRRIEVARQSGVPEEPLQRYSEARARPELRDRRDRRAAPQPRPRRRGPHRPRHLAGLRDARPRAVARLPLPGGAPDPDLRRPPPRPRLVVLRLRLLARSGRRVPALARPRPGARRAALPRRPRPDVHRRPGAHRRQPDARARAPRRRVEEVIAAEPGLTAFEAIPKVYGEAITPLNANWWLSETLCLPAPPGGHRAPASASAGRRSAGSRGISPARRPVSETLTQLC